MSEHSIERVWELMESVRFCMFSTWNGRELRSRPMGAFVRRKEDAIYFFTDVRAHKDEEIAQFPKVCLAFADAHKQKYVSVSGIAEMVSDSALVRELWSIPTKLWWESPDDPNLRLIKVTPQDVEYWDTPGNVVSSIKVAFVPATGKRVSYGDHEKVAF
jgi:general stress protein 26